MSLFRRSKNLKVQVELEDSWGFAAEGEQDMVVALFGAWLEGIKDDSPEPEKKPFRMGFQRAEDLGTTESNIQLSPSAIDLDGEVDEE